MIFNLSSSVEEGYEATSELCAGSIHDRGDVRAVVYVEDKNQFVALERDEENDQVFGKTNLITRAQGKFSNMCTYYSKVRFNRTYPAYKCPKPKLTGSLSGISFTKKTLINGPSEVSL